MKYYLLALLVFAMIQVQFSYTKKSDRQQIYIPPSKKLKHFTFGYNDFLSSLMWVRVVQDFHVCDQTDDRSEYEGYSTEGDVIGNILNRKMPKSTCESGWVYQMLDVITDLTPDFDRVYLDGGTMLSVMVDDREGASKILDKGIKMYPDDWQLLYRAAYHELFEMQNGRKAAELLRRAGDRGAPEWVYSLAAQVYTKFGQAAFAKTILETVLERDRAGVYKSRLEGRLNEINKTLQQEAPKQ